MTQRRFIFSVSSVILNLACTVQIFAATCAYLQADNTTNVWRSHSEGFFRCFTLTGHTHLGF